MSLKNASGPYDACEVLCIGVDALNQGLAIHKNHTLDHLCDNKNCIMGCNDPEEDLSEADSSDDERTATSDSAQGDDLHSQGYAPQESDAYASFLADDDGTSGGAGAAVGLAIPANMQMFPLLALGLLKHVALRQSNQIAPDLRAYAQALLATLPSQTLIPYIHPCLYSLHKMPPECGMIGENGVVLPPLQPLTHERFEKHGLFLIEDGQNVFLWVGRDAVLQLVSDVFGLPNYEALRAGEYTMLVLDNVFSQRVNAIVGMGREMRREPFYPVLFEVRRQGGRRTADAPLGA
ncbi:hypothetical protein AURDEDRAFT_131923 [Auricularia subglabra TFB-10046 SS5]|uniref:Gelsolin-like domain-containing protein n=1 Tax=Auricularia subglabra (strain TFB-10046 / SS5) TaxID=717982 RepID=J0WMC6_AURST|nr:hypothetical protein AURDEDRAFT_131923 [Auricularia subglabra TFB-10046 SS5]